MASIGDLVANLTVDSTGFTKGLGNAKKSMSSFVGSMGSIVAPVAGAIAGIWGVSSSISGYKEALEGQRKLASVLEATGNAAGITQAEIETFAGEMQSLTNFEGDATVAAASMLAAFTNIRGDIFTDTIEGAMNLSTVMGGDLNSNVALLGKSLNDPIEGMKKLAKAGVQFSDAEIKQVEALQKSGDMIGAQQIMLAGLEERFGGAAEAVADPWTQLTNTLGDMGEMFGSLLLPSINVVAEAFMAGAEMAMGWGETVKSYGIEAAVVIENIGGLLQIGMKQWQLYFVQAGNDAVFLFTDQIPALLTWFSDNFTSVIFTAVDYASTVFINLGQNIRNVWSAVLEFIKGNGFEFDWTPLTEGAVSAIDKLPEIPQRVSTQFEQSLQADIASMSDATGQAMAETRAELEKTFSVASNMTLPKSDVTEIETGKDTGKKTSSSGSSQAAFAGSREALQIAMRGVGTKKDPVVDLTKELVKLSQKQLALQERQAEPTTETSGSVVKI